MKIKNLTILLILLSLSMLLVSGCDDRDFPTSSEAQYKITRLESSVDKIYADNNVTFSYITAYVKDRNNFGASGIPVNFQADRGSIITLANTNQSGIAKVPFYDAGEVGLATITAFVYTPSTLDETQNTAENSMTVQVLIEEKPAIGALNIEISSTEFFVNQSVVVRARVYDILSSPVADSTMIRFETDRGYFVADDGETNMGSIAIVPTQNGNAPLRLNVGQQAGMGEVTVRIDTLQASTNFTVKPGNPFNLELVSYLADDDLNPIEYTTETSIDNDYKIVIEANLKDAYNNPNPNKVVRFETTLGSFYNTSETYNQNTDAAGVSRVVFTPGLSAGAATIKAFANADTLTTELLFIVKSDELHAIRFNTQEQVHLNVTNTGGLDSKILYVSLYDINGNLVDRATDIYFKIINDPIPGTDQGQPAYLSGQDGDGVVHSTSSGGQAAVSVVTGAGSGVLQLRVANSIEALTGASSVDAITATKTNILIHAGPPANIFFGQNTFDQGESLGGGLWELLIAVSVKDRYSNPVDYGTAVWFSLPGNLSDATIQGNGYTGNGPFVTSHDAAASEVDSLSSVGIAYTLLIYSSGLTNQLLDIQASCVGLNYDTEPPTSIPVETVYSAVMPWNEPDTDLQIIPGHTDFYDVPSDNPGDIWDDPMDSDTDPDYVQCRIRTRDGQGFPIDGVSVSFTSDRGQFYTSTPLLVANPNVCETGVDGYGEVLLQIIRGDGLPSPDGVSPGQQQVQVEARILGTGISERGSFMILRFPFANPF